MTQCSQIKDSTIEKCLLSKGDTVRDFTNPLARLRFLQECINKNLELHFGIRPGLLSDNMIKAVASEIANKYDYLNAQDIDNAFDNYIVDTKDSWKQPTKAQIIAPISLWANQKRGIEIEYDKFQKEQNDKIENKLKAEQFKAEAVDMYRKALVSGQWEGTLFHATTLAREILSNRLSKRIKDELWLEAKSIREEKEREADANQDSQVFDAELLFATRYRIAAELIVLKSIELGVEI